MAAIRHPSVHTADSTGSSAGNDVLDLAAVAIREVLALADIAPSDASMLVIAASGVPAGEDAADPVLENAFADGLVRELVWETGLQHAVPIAVGFLGEPVLTTGVLTALGLLMAERLDHAMVVVLNLGEPGALGAAAFLMSAEEDDGLLIRHVEVEPDRLPSADPGAGMVELLLRNEDAGVQGVLESMRRMIDAGLTHGEEAVLIEGSAHGVGELRLERLQQ